MRKLKKKVANVYLLNRLRYLIRRFVAKRDYNRRAIYVHPDSYVEPGTVIGFGTRINQASHIGKCEIGRYCAFGGRLVVRSTDHFTGFMNMQGHLQSEVIKSNVPVVGKSKGMVRLGHASWIGDSVIILPGVCIGIGAIIGAGSVVTKDIPNFAVAVGNPARVIKFRFSEEMITFIMELSWWDWDARKIKRNARLFEMDLTSTSLEHVRSIEIL